jgi:Uma2 family endonuclease
MTAKLFSFADYLHYDDGTDNRYELTGGVLIALPPESGLNVTIAHYLFLKLVAANVSFQLIKVHACELQVTALQRGDAQNRYPDLVVLRQEHLALTQRRLTITLDMPPPVLVVEVVSPGQANRNRDFGRKRAQYAERGIPEYWLIDPENQAVIILSLEAEQYIEVGTFREETQIHLPTFPGLKLSAAELFSVAQSST